jgi:dTDP-4-amino-4,6-dideoxygalactose transaminase
VGEVADALVSQRAQYDAGAAGKSEGKVNAYDVVRQFEQCVADYAGASYGVAVESCTSAILLSCAYWNVDEVSIPKRTYVGVAMSILHAGGRVRFLDFDWRGYYQLQPYMIIDSARHFCRGMYQPGTLWCLSFHWEKHLPIGRGGMILTDSAIAVKWLRRARFDSRREGVAPKVDDFVVPGWHCYMIPELAARGLNLMATMPDDNEDLPNSDYADLSRFPIFKKRGKAWWRE